MPNAFWFIAVAVLFLLPFLYLSWKVRDRRILAVYLTMGGFTYFFEFIIFVLLHSYAYHPHLLKDRFLDDVMGAFLSDAFVIPMSSTMAGALHFTWKGIVPLAAFIALIERLFVRLHVFELHWWRTWFTLFGTIAWLTTGKQLYHRLRRPLAPVLRMAMLCSANLLIQASLVFFAVGFFHAYRYHVGWFTDGWRDHVAFATVLILLFALVFTAVVHFRLNWGWKALLLAALLLLDILLLRLHILHLTPRWSLVHFLLMRAFVIAALDGFNLRVLDRIDDAARRSLV